MKKAMKSTSEQKMLDVTKKLPEEDKESSSDISSSDSVFEEYDQDEIVIAKHIQLEATNTMLGLISVIQEMTCAFC